MNNTKVNMFWQKDYIVLQKKIEIKASWCKMLSELPE